MGITISSKKYGCDMGYGGFGRFRCTIANLVNEEVGKHYADLEKAMLLLGKGERTRFFEEYNKKTNDLIADMKLSVEVANFLHQSDCEGKIDKNQAEEIYQLIKKCDDSDIFGYVGRNDCATMLDLKNIFNDGTQVKWY